VLAALWAQQRNYNEAIILNSHNRIAETTIANLFLIAKNGCIKTPSLQEGCIAGVMRRHVLEVFKNAAFVVEEIQIEWEDIVQAEELFITNTQKGIQSIQYCEGRLYPQNFAKKAFERFIIPLWQTF
jgi:branched-chain amino acid aminotransferase